MTIFLKELLNEVEGKPQRRVQIYCDMDGVLADMDARFEEMSGGYTPDNFKVKFDGDPRRAQREFWKVIARDPNFWLSLKVMPDALKLWSFIKQNFTDLPPVLLSAGQGASVIQQKTQWAHKHIDPNVKVIIADAGARKPNYILNYPSDQNVLHVLLDDTSRNISAWNDPHKNRVAILYKDYQSAVEQLSNLIP